MKLLNNKATNNNSKKIIGIAAGALSTIPIFFAIKYFLDTRKVKKAISKRDEYIAQLNNEIDKMPTSNEGYNEYLKDTTVDEKALNHYNEALAEVKKNGVISDECLSKNGFTSQADFEDAMNTAFIEGKQGNSEALDTFNELYSSYQDDLFAQAQEIASTKYYDAMLIEYSNINADMSAITTIGDTPIEQNTLLGAGTILLTVGVGYLGYKLYKNHNKKSQQKDYEK